MFHCALLSTCVYCLKWFYQPSFNCGDHALKMFFLAILYALELGEIEKILVWPLGMTNISILFLKKKILHS
jgi:hypothetical protein